MNMQLKLQQSVLMTNGLPRFQFIDRVGHCSSATVTGIPLVLTVQKNVKLPLCSFFGELVNARRCATTGVGFRQCCPVEVPLLEFVDSRRHPCCGGSDSACGVAKVTVISTVVDIPVVAHRQV